ncbi:radical SAM protein [Candidatus Dojkabacteria bacterium]|jgi:adenine C2-methylase RlmN of 23S rRNA A2503 and tRNA A37|nr:radical SAM protein [Candidatus Dojkabacteria bacterium]
MRLIKTTKSTDNTSVRYDFESDRGIMEIMKVINEEPAKRTILCVPSSYGCALGCTFCHLTKAGSTSNKPVLCGEIEDALTQIDYDKNIPLLISMMGAGEPLLNLDLVHRLSTNFPISLATSLPTTNSIHDLIKYIKNNPHRSIKIYVSIHSFIQEVRQSLMPNSIHNPMAAIKDLTNLPNLPQAKGHTSEDLSRVVVHYTLIPGINDDKRNFAAMVENLRSLENPPKMKFLKWSDGDNTAVSRDWVTKLLSLGLKASFHSPHGNDIGGACGQFNPEYYK